MQSLPDGLSANQQYHPIDLDENLKHFTPKFFDGTERPVHNIRGISEQELKVRKDMLEYLLKPKPSCIHYKGFIKYSITVDFRPKYDAKQPDESYELRKD